MAEVPELPGCMAHGATPQAAVANAQEAIALWIDTAEDDDEARFWMGVSQAALDEIWDNPEDDV